MRVTVKTVAGRTVLVDAEGGGGPTAEQGDPSPGLGPCSGIAGVPSVKVISDLKS